MMLFHHLFPELIDKETRCIDILNNEVIPDDRYILVECYCPKLDCDCRRVLLKVIAKEHTEQGELLTISFGFDREKEMAGPYIDPMNPRCSYADALFRIIAPMLETDTDYADRLESHYHMVKRAVKRPTPREKQILVRYGLGSDGQPKSSKSRRTKKTRKQRKKRRK